MIAWPDLTVMLLMSSYWGWNSTGSSSSSHGHWVSPVASVLSNIIPLCNWFCYLLYRLQLWGFVAVICYCFIPNVFSSPFVPIASPLCLQCLSLANHPGTLPWCGLFLFPSLYSTPSCGMTCKHSFKRHLWSSYNPWCFKCIWSPPHCGREWWTKHTRYSIRNIFAPFLAILNMAVSGCKMCYMHSCKYIHTLHK